MLFRNPVEFEIPDDWWSEADMLGFTSEGQADHAVPGSDLKLGNESPYPRRALRTAAARTAGTPNSLPSGLATWQIAD
jgi:hypothetical protein